MIKLASLHVELIDDRILSDGLSIGSVVTKERPRIFLI